MQFKRLYYRSCVLPLARFYDVVVEFEERERIEIFSSQTQ